MKQYFVAPFAMLLAAAPQSKAPDCSGPDHYAANVTLATLKNAHVVSSDTVVFKGVTSKTIASQRIGKDLWRQVFRVTFPLKLGNTVEAIVVSDASAEECSMSNPKIFLISKAF